MTNHSISTDGEEITFSYEVDHEDNSVNVEVDGFYPESNSLIQEEIISKESSDISEYTFSFNPNF